MTSRATTFQRLRMAIDLTRWLLVAREETPWWNVQFNLERALQATTSTLASSATSLRCPTSPKHAPCSGRGRDAVVQLVRAFSSEGCSTDVEVWLRAYFAAGGTFHHSESIEKLRRR